MSASLRNVGAITLFVDDLPRSRSFYQDVFGLRVVYEDDVSAVFDFGNTLINLLAMPAARDLMDPVALASRDAGSRVLLTIWVDDADAVCAEIDRHEAVLLSGPIDRECRKRTASFSDPDGNIWEIAQDLPRPT